MDLHEVEWQQRVTAIKVHLAPATHPLAQLTQAYYLARAGDHEQARGLAMAAAGRAVVDGDPLLLARARLVAARLQTDDSTRSAESLSDAIQLFQQVKATGDQVEALCERAKLHVLASEAGEGMAALLRASRLIDDNWHESLVYSTLIMILIDAQLYREASDYLAEAKRQAATPAMLEVEYHAHAIITALALDQVHEATAIARELEAKRWGETHAVDTYPLIAAALAYYRAGRAEATIMAANRIKQAIAKARSAKVRGSSAAFAERMALGLENIASNRLLAAYNHLVNQSHHTSIEMPGVPRELVAWGYRLMADTQRLMGSRHMAETFETQLSKYNEARKPTLGMPLFLSRGREPVLTNREFAVLQARARGQDVKVIAYQMNLSEHTVRALQRSLARKLGVKSARELASVARARNLL